MDVRELFGAGKEAGVIGQLVKAKFMSRLATLEKIGKHVTVGAFIERSETTHLSYENFLERAYSKREKETGEKVM